jgi:hypothetical protein
MRWAIQGVHDVNVAWETAPRQKGYVDRISRGRHPGQLRQRIVPQSDVALKDGSKMMFHSRAAQTTILATGFALVLLLAALDGHAHAEGNLDASYTISFARIRVGDIAATVVFGDNEYAISARGRAGGVMKILVDGEASFTTRGTVKNGHPVPTTFTSKIISNAEISDVTMVLDEGGVKELAAGSLRRKPSRVNRRRRLAVQW